VENDVEYGGSGGSTLLLHDCWRVV